MGQIISYVRSILFGRENIVWTNDEESIYKTLASCDEGKPNQPNSRYVETRVSKEDEGEVVIVVPNAGFREAVEPSPPASINPYTNPASKDETATLIDIEDVKSIAHVSTVAKIKVSKDGLPKEKKIKHYRSSQKILLVGEGDFSFSACLAKAFGSAENMVATSLNSKDFLKKHYSNAMSNIDDLESGGCMVLHGVDATNMSGNKFLKGMRFDRIIFNFPHAGFSHKESESSQLSRHQKLVTLFFKNAKKMLLENGEIHVSHKTSKRHSKWDIESLASYSGLSFIKKVKFHLNDYPGYQTKYGFGGDGNFNCYPSNTYMFGL